MVRKRVIAFEEKLHTKQAKVQPPRGDALRWRRRGALGEVRADPRGPQVDDPAGGVGARQCHRRDIRRRCQRGWGRPDDDGRSGGWSCC